MKRTEVRSAGGGLQVSGGIAFPLAVAVQRVGLVMCCRGVEDLHTERSLSRNERALKT